MPFHSDIAPHLYNYREAGAVAVVPIVAFLLGWFKRQSAA